jgi:hypothetical protein
MHKIIMVAEGLDNLIKFITRFIPIFPHAMLFLALVIGAALLRAIGS